MLLAVVVVVVVVDVGVGGSQDHSITLTHAFIPFALLANL